MLRKTRETSGDCKTAFQMKERELANSVTNVVGNTTDSSRNAFTQKAIIEGCAYKGNGVLIKVSC